MELTLQDRLRAALVEDLADVGDVTTDAIFPPDAQCKARVIAKEDGVLCGVEIFEMVFDILGGVSVAGYMKDGSAIKRGDVVVRLAGSTRSVLAGERTALNLMQYLSGVATQTRRFVDAVGGRVDVCDTRKTTPLWRDLKKFAVKCGGGKNHRMGLYDMVMIKDTHADGAGSLAEAIRRVKHLQGRMEVAAEARNLEEVRMAIEGGVDLIMLDNMPFEQMREAIAIIGGRIRTEVTGGVTIESAKELSNLGVNRLSIGAITHSVKAIDFSLKFE